MKLGEGKPPRDVLEEIVFKYTGSFDPDLVKGPSIGEDAGIVRAGEGFIVAHSDPITAAERYIGWLAINVAANDVAVRGVWPRWILLTVLLPPGSTREVLERIMREADEAARAIGSTIIGGHTEVTPGLPRPIVVATAIGYTRGRVIYTGAAQPGDNIVVIGRVGGEAAAVIAWDFVDKLVEKGVSKDVIERARGFIKEISVVKAALAIKDYVSAMHDPTEGGILNALLELAIACNNKVVVNIDKIHIDPVVRTITGAVGIDPYRSLSSGSLIATVPYYNLDKIVSILDSIGISYNICGEVVEGDPVLEIWRDNRKSIVNDTIVDEIYKLWLK